MITKPQFIVAIEALELQYRKDVMFNQKVTALFDMQSEGLPLYDNSVLRTVIINLLGLEFDKTEIERFCYELDFGKAEGADIKTAEDLWNHVNLL